MKWSKEICSILILTLLLVMTSVHESISEANEFDDCTDQVIMRGTIFESYVQSSVNETTAYGQPRIDVNWGWTGNLSFSYWDVTEDEGISGATVTCRISGVTGIYHISSTLSEIFDLGDGTYLVEVNTTNHWTLPTMWYYLFVSFNKTGFEYQEVVTMMWIIPVATQLVVYSPEVNQINENQDHLKVPLGDSIDIQFLYNDTDDSDGYVGGLEEAQVYARIVGPTLVEHYMEVVDQGNGNYSLTFDTTSDWLFEAVGGTPTSHELSYLIYLEFSLENRVPWDLLLNITIINIPTELALTPAVEDLQQLRDQYSIFVSLMDIWPTHDNALIQDVNITVESSDTTLLEIVSITEDSPEVGVYNITLLEIPSPGGGCCPIEIPVDLTINIEKDDYESQSQVITVYVSEIGGGWTPPLTYSPVLIVVFIVGILLFRNKRKLRATEELPGNE